MARSSDHLERMLTDLGDRVAWPPEDDLAPSVRSRLETEEAAGRPRRWAHALAVAAVLLVVVAGILTASPAAREAVADLLEMGGVRITTGIPVPDVPGASLDLGEAVTLREALARVEFPVLVPRDPDLGPPQAVFHREPPRGGQVSLVWEARAGLPAAPGTEVGLLITQFTGSLDPVLEKVLDPETDLEAVMVRGERGLWIEGAPHRLSYLSPDGEVLEDELRLAANVLLWEEEGVTYRVESALDREDALRIARSLGPAR